MVLAPAGLPFADTERLRRFRIAAMSRRTGFGVVCIARDTDDPKIPAARHTNDSGEAQASRLSSGNSLAGVAKLAFDGKGGGTDTGDFVWIDNPQ